MTMPSALLWACPMRSNNDAMAGLIPVAALQHATEQARC
jgi:hypothetical protein